MCNPLGSHSGVHKLGKNIHTTQVYIYIHASSGHACIHYVGMFYYTLGNLRPELRSTQRSIQLIACVKSPLLGKYGFEAVLRPFIDDVNSLASVSQCMATVLLPQYACNHLMVNM